MCDSSLQHRLLLANLHHSGCFQGIFQPLQILSIQSKESIRNSSCARRWLESVFQLDYNIYRSSRYSFEFDHLEIVVPQQSCPSTENFACDTRSLLKLKDSRGKRANQTPFPPSDGASFSTRNQWSENNIIQGDVDSRHVIRRRSGSLHFFFKLAAAPSCSLSRTAYTSRSRDCASIFFRPFHSVAYQEKAQTFMNTTFSRP
mmetsp:Transcript_6768/g.12386  ORF Transcript_6768/g.12386 Transcript_6768/m.12386 type:complete len:202 (-) Transcript_6768:2928-3533(-)